MSSGTRKNSKSNSKKANTNLANSENAINYPPLLSQKNLFTYEGPRFLLDERASMRILREKATLLSITPSRTVHGQGSYGYVTSAEVRLRSEGREFTTIAAFKVNQHPINTDLGFAADVLREISLYSRAAQSHGLAKGFFAELSVYGQSLVMEHYIMNLHDVFRRATGNNARKPPMNRPTTLSGPPKFDVIRGVLFQAATALQELHSLGALHKDLKPANMLLSHDGRVLLTDYGLSEYSVTGIQTPASYYFPHTTPTIQPPESLKNPPTIGPAYDVFSLGMSFLFFLTRTYYLNFYAYGNSWITTIKDEHYMGLLQYLRNELKAYPKEILDLLFGMIDVNPATRFNLKQILDHPWLKGLTLSEAARIVREGLFQGTQAYGQRAATLIQTTRKRTYRVNSPPSMEVANYFSIRLQPLMTKIPKFPEHDRYTFMTYILEKGLDSRIDLYTLLHAIELVDRLCTNRSRTNSVYLYDVALCMNIAYKLQPFSIHGSPQFFFEMASREVKLASNNPREFMYQTLEAEASIIADLQGDLFPQKGGLVDSIFDFLSEMNPSAFSRPDIETHMIIAIVLFIYTRSKGGTTLQDIFRSSVDIIKNPYDIRINNLMKGIDPRDTVYFLLLGYIHPSILSEDHYLEGLKLKRKFESIFSNLPVPDSE